MANYKVKHTPILYDGERYKPGDQVDMDVKNAKQHQDNLEPVKAGKEKNDGGNAQ